MNLVEYLCDLWGGSEKPSTLVHEAQSLVDDSKTLTAHLAIYCGVMESRMPKDHNGHTDEKAMAFEQGRRDVFLHIMAVAGLKPSDFEQLLTDIESETRAGEEL